jgi:hypothetical protein
MNKINLTGKIDKNGHLKLDVPTDYPPGFVDLSVVFYSSAKQKSRKYDFSQFTGVLKTKIKDPVKAQRKLRNEWK